MLTLHWVNATMSLAESLPWGSPHHRWGLQPLELKEGNAKILSTHLLSNKKWKNSWPLPHHNTARLPCYRMTSFRQVGPRVCAPTSCWWTEVWNHGHNSEKGATLVWELHTTAAGRAERTEVYSRPQTWLCMQITSLDTWFNWFNFQTEPGNQK